MGSEARLRLADWQAEATRLNQLPEDEWMRQPIALRVALDVLNPACIPNPTSLERELALYVVGLSQRQ